MIRVMQWCLPILVTAIAVAAIAQSRDSQSRDSRSRNRSSQQSDGSRSSSTQPAETAAPEPAPVFTSAPTKKGSVVAPVRGASQEYEVISQRNIFMKRQAFTPRPSTPPTTRPSPPPSLFDESPSASAWALTGTAIVNGERVAFLENTRTGDTMLATIGTSIASIKVIAIDSDGIEIGKEGHTQRVAVGVQLDGSSRASYSGSGMNSSTPSTQPSGGSSSGTGSPGGSADSIEERMRARRRQEEGK